MTPEEVNAKIAENFDKYVKKVSKTVVQYYIVELQKWVYNRSITKHLSAIGMTKQEWYDKYILQIASTNDRPRCPACGKILPFTNILTVGYAKTCNRACLNKHKWSLPSAKDASAKLKQSQKQLWADSDRRKRQSAALKSAMQSTDVRRKISEHTKLAMQREDVKERLKAGIAEANRRQSVHDNRSVVQKANWQKHGFRHKMLQAFTKRDYAAARQKRKQRRLQQLQDGTYVGSMRTLKPFANCHSGHIHVNNCLNTDNAFYKSALELKAIQYLEQLECLYEIETFRCTYIEPCTNDIKIYIADFVVYINDAIYVVEVKPEKYVNNEYVVAKAAGANNIIKRTNKFDTYIFIIEKDLASLSTFASKFCQQFNCRIAM